MSLHIIIRFSISIPLSSLY